MNIVQNILEAVSNNAATSLEKETGFTNEQIMQGMKMLSGIFSHQISQNVNENTENNFINALASHMPSGSDSGFDLADGAKILSHIFGNKQDSVAHAFGESMGTDLGTSETFMQAAASIFMDQLSQSFQKKNIDQNSLISTLQSTSHEVQQENSLVSDMISSVLDKNHDGHIMDDVVRAGMNAFGKNA